MWSTSKSDYEFSPEPIGVGSYGQVFRATHRPDGKSVAVKQMDLKFLKRYNILKRVKTELKNHARLDHPNIVRLYTYFQDQKHIYLVMELCSKRLIEKGLKRDLTRAKSLLRQLAAGLQYLHACNFIHRDIKPDNIMLLDDDTVKILDLGLSCKLEHATDRKKTVCGTEGYLAPEIVAQKGYDERVDIFSLGCVVYKMLTGRRMGNGEVAFPAKFPPSGQDLIMRMTEKDPERRISIANILKHRFLSSARSQSISQSQVRRCKQKYTPIKVVMEPREHLIKSGKIDIFEDGSSAYSSSRDGSVCRFQDNKISIVFADDTSEAYDLEHDDLPEMIQKKYNMMRRFFLKQQKLVHLSCPAWNTSCLMTGVDPEFDFTIKTADNITAVYSTHQNSSTISISNGSGKIVCDFDPLQLNHKLYTMFSSRLQQLLQLSAHMVTKCHEILKTSTSNRYPISRSENVLLSPPNEIYAQYPPQQYPSSPFGGGHTYPYYMPAQPPMPYFYPQPPPSTARTQKTKTTPQSTNDVAKAAPEETCMPNIQIKPSEGNSQFHPITLNDLASLSPVHDNLFSFSDDELDDVKENESSRVFNVDITSPPEKKSVEPQTFQSSHRKTRKRKNSTKLVMQWPTVEEVYFNRIKDIYTKNSKEISRTKLFNKFQKMKPHSIYIRVCDQFKESPLPEYTARPSVHEYYKKKIVEIYKNHNPLKLKKVLSTFETVSGEEIYRFFRDVCEKYKLDVPKRYILPEFHDETAL